MPGHGIVLAVAAHGTSCSELTPAPACCAPQDKPEQLRAELEALLSGAGIAYSYSATSKFANFRNRTLE